MMLKTKTMDTGVAMRRLSAILLALPLQIGLIGHLPAQSRPDADRPPQPPNWVQQGAIVDGRIYVVVKRKVEKLGWANLVSADLRSGQGKKAYVLPSEYGAERPYRWRIRHGYFWGNGDMESRSMSAAVRIPLDDLPILAADNKNMAADYRKKYNDDTMFRYQWDLSPVANQAEFFKFDKPADLDFDLCPISATACPFFVLKRRTMLVFKGEGELPKANNSTGSWVVSWEQLTEFHAGFQEPFNAYVHGPNYYFVTQSGKMYRSKPEGKGHSTELVWKGESEPITAVVCDVAADATFLLAQAPPGGQSKCLILNKTGDFVQRAIDPAKLDTGNSDEPLEACLPFAQYLLATGLLATQGPR